MFYVMSGNKCLCGAVMVVEMRCRGCKFLLFVSVSGIKAFPLQWTEALALQKYIRCECV